MYRTNDAELAGAVMACRESGDVEGMLESVRALWLAPPESAETSETDVWVDESWRALRDAGVVRDGVQFSTKLIHERRRIRPRAFLHTVQAIRALESEKHQQKEQERDQPSELSKKAVETLLDMATICLEETWFDDRYLGSVFVALIEGNSKRALYPFLRDNLEALRGDDRAWLLVTLVIATTSLGTAFDLGKWVKDWRTRSRVPMWLACLVCDEERVGRYGSDEIEKNLDVARDVVSSFPRDGSENYLVCLELECLYRLGRVDEFAERLEEERHRLEAWAAKTSYANHPVVAYSNRFKVGQKIREEDFEHHAPDAYVIGGGPSTKKERVNQRLVDMARTMGRYEVNGAKVLLLFSQLLAVDDKDGSRIRALHKEFQRTRKSPSLRWSSVEWNKLVAKRAKFWTRLALAMS